MGLKDMKLEDLELMSYTDLTYKILKEENKPLNTPTIFHHICDLLGYSNEEFEDKIGDYYNYFFSYIIKISLSINFIY